MKIITLLVVFIATFSIVDSSNKSDKRLTTFYDYFEETQLLQFAVNPKIPVRLLRKLVATKSGKEMKNLRLYAKDLEMNDSAHLDDYQITDGKVRVLEGKSCKVEFVNIDTEKWIHSGTVEPFAPMKFLKHIIANKYEIEPETITFYYGQVELKDDDYLAKFNVKDGATILVHME